jgi:hypothetical protein
MGVNYESWTPKIPKKPKKRRQPKPAVKKEPVSPVEKQPERKE